MDGVQLVVTSVSRVEAYGYYIFALWPQSAVLPGPTRSLAEEAISYLLFC